MSILARLLRRDGATVSQAHDREGGFARPHYSGYEGALHEISRQADKGDLVHALRLTYESLAHSPEESSLLFARAAILEKWGRFREATVAFRAVRLRAAYPNAMLARQHGWSELNSGNLPTAEECMRQAVALEPTAESWSGLGYVLHLKPDIQEAVLALQRSIALEAHDLRSLLVLATCELIRNRFSEAESILRDAIARGAAASGWVNLGVALERQDRIEEATAAYVEAERLESLNGEQVGARTNLAVALSESGEGNKALELLGRQSERARPYRQYIHGIALLREGHLATGWNLHEFRWACEPLVAQRAHLAMPMWAGQVLEGKVLLIRAEQGFGDTMQFIRYAPWLKQLGARVHVRVQVGLEKLAESVKGVDLVEVSGKPSTPADYYIHPMSLPRVFGTDLTTIPLGIPYVDLDEATRVKWSQRIKQSGRLRVGIAWAGNPDHKRDHLRSVSLTQLEPVLATGNVDFYSLQKGAARLQIRASAHGGSVIDIGPDLLDFADTAAVISLLDLIVCVDTSVAHLAGALGQPVWVLVSRPADFRWMQDRTDSPWYPTMRLFRQQERGRWDGPISELADALQRLAAAAPAEQLTGRANYPLAPAPTPLPPLSHRLPGLSALAETRYGMLEYLPDQPVVGPSLAFYGEHLQLQLEEVLRRCPTDSSIVHVGGGVGQDVLALSTQVGAGGHVIVYEADVRRRQLLAQNMSYNQVTNVTVLPRVPLGSQADSSDLGAMESVDDLRLDQLHWLIIDDEVSAGVALDGASETIWRARPLLLIRVRNSSAMHAVAEKARSYGYFCWLVETPFYSSENFNRWEEDIFCGKTAIALVCAPEETDLRANPDWRALV